MTREEILQEVLQIPNRNILLELATSTGKSRIAIERINQIQPKGKILIVIPRLVLIQNWKDEFIKWGYEKYLPQVEFVTYVSLPKLVHHNYTIAIYDECFRGDTEILTNSGYKQFQNLTEEDLVAQWNNGKIEFVKPIRLIKRWHDSPICKIYLKRDKYLYVTPKHNQPYYNTKTNSFITEEIDKLPNNILYKYITTGKGTGNNTLLTNLEKVYIAIQADGALQRHQKNESVYSIQLTKGRKKERFLKLIEYSNRFNEIYTKRPNSRRWLCKLPKGDAKLLSTHFNVNMGYDRANDFINEVVQWDGSRIVGQLYYSSKIKENSDFVAAVAIQAGYQVFQNVEYDNRKENYSCIYRVYMKKPKNNIGDITLNPKQEYIPFNDYVYCVEVPSHKIVIRSEGVTFISGNCHHLSDRCQLAVPYINSNYNILLSATIKRTLRPHLNRLFNNLYIYKISLKDAVDNDILPEPRIVLIPLKLETTQPNEIYAINPKKPYQKTISYTQWLKGKWQYLRGNFNYGVKVQCTQLQKYQEMCSFMDNCTKKLQNNLVSGMNRIMVEQARKRKGLERLQWLAEIKSDFVKQLLKQLKDYRTLTFCYNIKQTEYLGKYCINSKNKKKSIEYLKMFNDKKIKHITAAGILNEGSNLTACRCGVFANYHSSELISIQRCGRILRHSKPVFYMPYYENTKEEEIVQKMIEGYDSSLIVKAINPFNFNEYINR